MKRWIQKAGESLRHCLGFKGARVGLVCTAVLGILCGVWNLAVMPSTLLGVPSWQWVPDGMKVGLDNGDCIRYLTQWEEKRLIEKYGRVSACVSWAKYDPYYQWNERWGTEREKPNIMVCGEVTEVRNLEYIPKEHWPGDERFRYRNSCYAIVTMKVEDVLFDVREDPIQAGESITVFSMDSEVDSLTVGYPLMKGNRYYLTLYWKDPSYEGYGFNRFVYEQADYENYADLRSRWPVLDGQVYDFPGVTIHKITNSGEVYFTMDHNVSDEAKFREILLPRMQKYEDLWKEKLAAAGDAAQSESE